jgi:hypothetical protein
VGLELELELILFVELGLVQVLVEELVLVVALGIVVVLVF